MDHVNQHRIWFWLLFAGFAAASARNFPPPADNSRERKVREEDLNALKFSLDQLKASLGQAVLAAPDDTEELKFDGPFTYEVGRPETDWQSSHETTNKPKKHEQKNHWERVGITAEQPISVEPSILHIKAGVQTITTSSDDSDDGRAAPDTKTDHHHLTMVADAHSNIVNSLDTEPRHKQRHHRRRKLRNKHHRRKGCPRNKHGRLQLLCPSTSHRNYDVCITADQLCDNIRDCPRGEDEHAINCLFYTTTKEHLKQVYNTVMALADHVVKRTDDHHEL